MGALNFSLWDPGCAVPGSSHHRVRHQRRGGTFGVEMARDGWNIHGRIASFSESFHCHVMVSLNLCGNLDLSSEKQTELAGSVCHLDASWS